LSPDNDDADHERTWIMRLATFLAEDGTGPRAGDVRGDTVVGFAAGVTVADLIATGARPDATGAEFPLSRVRLIAPYRPRVVFLVGANYRAHVDAAQQVGMLSTLLAPGEIPCLLKGPGSPIGPYDDVIRPPKIEALDYEGELMVVAGGACTVAGYAVANDISARDAGDRWQLTRQKAGDTFCPWGPWVTTEDEIADPYDLRIRTWVDDDLRQDGNTSQMIARIPEIMDYIGKTIEIQAGDLILTGTPAGTAVESANPRYLAPGQVVRVEIGRLGHVRNRIAAGPLDDLEQAGHSS
jgi:2-keto-4-pentenoate hydratase/2-oxohepta-3-ene-1,7-dioic acid hydratase in catechol pathway